MVRWMCSVKVKDRVPSKELRERLGIDDIILILQQNRLWWYGHVLWKENTDWVKKCMEYEVEGSRPRGRPKRTWMWVVDSVINGVHLQCSRYVMAAASVWCSDVSLFSVVWSYHCDVEEMFDWLWCCFVWNVDNGWCTHDTQLCSLRRTHT